MEKWLLVWESFFLATANAAVDDTLDYGSFCFCCYFYYCYDMQKLLEWKKNVGPMPGWTAQKIKLKQRNKEQDKICIALFFSFSACSGNINCVFIVEKSGKCQIRLELFCHLEIDFQRESFSNSDNTAFWY